MSVATGNAAEDAAAKYLQQQRYKILKRNWRTRVCEIDIVAKKSKVLYFVEVKYRKSIQQGSGLDYITDKKLAQMQFAARCYVEDCRYSGDYELAAIEVSGSEFVVSSFLPRID